MAKLVECVPNFSEGRNKEVIDAIADAISATEGCSLLDVDPGSSTNRTVYTFVGPPMTVIEGALNAARVAFKLIDMTKHSGEHPRMGAMDVCPFIPVQNVSMAECVQCANELGQRLSDMLNVPVYLYGEAARKESRRSLPSVRAGEYEALPEKLKKSEWAPEYGPTTFVPSWGATVTGARKFLIAYNVNLLSTKEQAHRIALDIREQGRGKDQPGLLRKVQGMGWYLEEANLAQVSTNILDFEVTPMHMVYEEICRDAKDFNLPVVGSQIVGLIPLKAMLDCADFYIQNEKLFIVEEEHKIRLVISKLGLESLGPFVPKERIIEYMVRDNQDDGRLVSLSLQKFVHSVGARTAAPGGGSVSAAIAAMGAALGCMVGQMTYGKRQFESLDAEMRKLIPPFHEAMNDLLLKVDADSTAFNSYMAALKLPKGTSDEIKRREEAMQEGLKAAVAVPLSLAERINTLWPVFKEMVKYGNVACKSDLQVSAKALETAVFGAYYNVIINLKDITDSSFRAATEAKVSALLKNARENANIALEVADQRK
ncbi:formimidoyltransferase-cyclodeaminase [Sinocyclocheilus anshuiensis]|uniref:Formimidoyltransferase-cyclodeaminase n=1 Tax=Sinocyclocheilus anshuiensis TaxID=1608454 RepID=A0A671NFP2_9TELE|nr:PREDICTED: formimidoyltransferase-cyclodeaminase [Sinocyclocheilus anshuiensis]